MSTTTMVETPPVTRTKREIYTVMSGLMIAMLLAMDDQAIAAARAQEALPQHPRRGVCGQPAICPAFHRAHHPAHSPEAPGWQASPCVDIPSAAFAALSALHETCLRVVCIASV